MLILSALHMSLAAAYKPPQALKAWTPSLLDSSLTKIPPSPSCDDRSVRFLRGVGSFPVFYNIFSTLLATNGVKYSTNYLVSNAFLISGSSSISMFSLNIVPISSIVERPHFVFVIISIMK